MDLKPARFISGLNVSDETILENIKYNCQLEVTRFKTKKAVVCGGGPSLADNLDKIREFKDQGFEIFCLNGSWKFLNENCIEHDAQIILDARVENVEFVNPNFWNVTYYVSSQCHPGVFESLVGRNVIMFHCSGTDGALELIKDVEPKATVLNSTSTSGLQALNILTVAGYQRIYLFGYDSSHRAGEHHAYPQALNDEQRLLTFDLNGKEYVSSGPMASQAQQFIASYRKYVERGIDLQVFGDGLLPDAWRFHEEARDDPELAEVLKYQKLWTKQDYRDFSPGEALVDTAIEELGIKALQKLIDFGCGTGRPTKAFIDRHIDAKGVDFASNCLDAELDGVVPLCVAPLWDLPHMQADYGFCVDVMEHIQPEKVHLVLKNIARCVPKAFFSISFRADQFGKYIGEKLHLTIHPAEWWMEQLNEHWPNVRRVGKNGFVVSTSLQVGD